jgi:predicted GTPase
VLFVGKVGAGKTTTINVLKDKHYVAPMQGLFVGTKDPKVEIFSIHSKQQKYFTIQILDTPGLFNGGLDANPGTSERNKVCNLPGTKRVALEMMTM